MSLALYTAPTAEPVTLAEARAQCRVTHAYHDVQIAGLIFAAREWAQAVTRRMCMTQTWDFYQHEFPSVIELPVAPIQSITSVKYRDTAGVEQTLSASAYEADLKSDIGLIRPREGYSWPTTQTVYNAVTVRFVAGYASGHPDLLTIRTAMLLHIEAHYCPENREALVKAAESLLWPLKITRF